MAKRRKTKPTNGAATPPPAGRRVRAELTPGRVAGAVEIPRDTIPRFGVVEILQARDGSVVPIIKNWGQKIRLTHDLPRRLGLDLSRSSLLRLMRADFIRYHQVTPGTILLDVASVAEHVAATQNGQEFWTPERIRRYREAL